jgi:hypothetical protein
MYQKECQRSLLVITDERLLGAARSDNQELLLEIFDKGSFDINFQDGYVFINLHSPNNSNHAS